MGDVIHSLAAIEDAKRAIPTIEFDWLVEEAFQEIPRWHPAVKEVFPLAWRRFRKTRDKAAWQVCQTAVEKMQAISYDLVIDLQGLIKSSLFAFRAKGLRVGLSFKSAREPLAALLYQKRIVVPWGQHAVTRLRQLMAQAIGYPCPENLPEYGIERTRLPQLSPDLPVGGVGLLHGTTWETKHWLERHWIALANIALASGERVWLSYGNEIERLRAETIVAGAPQVQLLPKLPLSSLAALLAQQKGLIACDTGLGHLAAALGTPTVSLYGPTAAKLTGAFGLRQKHMEAQDLYPCAPCLKRSCRHTTQIESGVGPCMQVITPEQVWKEWKELCVSH